ncbi:MAG: 30S ribosomal protein S21 [Ignavibacteriales bacterium]|nr:30S ribosomal protein S21 [Ignavibacteriales bacterium]
MVGINIGDNESIDKALRRFKKKYERSWSSKRVQEKNCFH